MGTRSLIHFQVAGKTFCTIYAQYDGYLSGVGNQILSLLKEREMVNGYTDPAKQANGPHCFAALYVSKYKGSDAGGLYIYTPDADDMWEDYTYTVNWVEGEDFGPMRLESIAVNAYDHVTKYLTLEEFEAAILTEDD